MNYFDDFLTDDIAADDRNLERAVLAGITGSADTDEEMLELAELAKTAGANVVGELMQGRDRPHPAHYLGKGKAEELDALVKELDADVVIVNDELTPAQLRNLSKMLNTKVIDRTALILDIFAMRARSAEGRAQVEMAQLKYNLSRLAGLGLGTAMSRLGGGIGTRGPGETKLETDRRHIRERLNKLRAEIAEIGKRRETSRKQREKSSVPIVSLMGYTNAGKSTIMNMLAGADVFVEDKLFATLDTTTRKINISADEVLLTDTVGFIQKLPTSLVEAFKSTLEEIRYADVLVHVVDIANPAHQNQMDSVYKTAAELGATDVPIITVFNKIDKLREPMPFVDRRASEIVRTSAISGQGKEDLLTAIERVLKSLRKRIKILLPFAEGQLIGFAHTHCTIISREHTENGVLLDVYGDDEAVGRLGKFRV